MRTRRLVYRRMAQADLRQIKNWMALRVSPAFARDYLRRIRTRIESLQQASERGTLREDIRPGLRAIGLMPSITVVFVVTTDRVVVFRVLYGGQDWQPLLTDSDAD